MASLIGDYSKAQKELGWKPKILTPQLAKIMVEYELIVETYL